MKWLIWFAAIFILQVISAGVFGQLLFLPVVPVLILVFCAVMIALEDKAEAVFAVVVSGVMLDFISGLPDGVMLLSLTVAGLFVYVLIYWWLAQEYNSVILFGSVALMTLLFFVCVLAFGKLADLAGMNVTLDYPHLLTNRILWYIVINLAAAYPVYLYYRFVRNIIFRFDKNRKNQ